MVKCRRARCRNDVEKEDQLCQECADKIEYFLSKAYYGMV
jgi:hypothetical protein